jgi:hypothetical protein
LSSALLTRPVNGEMPEPGQGGGLQNHGTVLVHSRGFESLSLRQTCERSNIVALFERFSGAYSNMGFCTLGTLSVLRWCLCAAPMYGSSEYIYNPFA